MREVKFRAWDKATNSWLEGVTYTLHTSGRLLTTPPDVELMQFTSLRDKNGKDIYEGDIIAWKGVHATGGQIAGTDVISYDQEQACFLLGTMSFVEDANSYNDLFIDFDALEVIGTIYENHELLEQA